MFSPCSGYGVCVNEPTPFRPLERGRCICNPGHGPADFLNSEGLDCLVSTSALNTWWLILAIGYTAVILFGLVKSLPYFQKEKWSPSAIRKNR